jgi:hypothetical protein
MSVKDTQEQGTLAIVAEGRQGREIRGDHTVLLVLSVALLAVQSDSEAEQVITFRLLGQWSLRGLANDVRRKGGMSYHATDFQDNIVSVCLKLVTNNSGCKLVPT